MRGEIDWDQLAMYVFGECSADQRSAVEAWARADPVRKEMLDELRAIYGETGRTPAQKVRDARRQERTWTRIRAHTEGDVDARRRRGCRSSIGSALGVAVVLAVKACTPPH